LLLLLLLLGLHLLLELLVLLLLLSLMHHFPIKLPLFGRHNSLLIVDQIWRRFCALRCCIVAGELGRLATGILTIILGYYRIGYFA
jgi:hypothetical protein